MRIKKMRYFFQSRRRIFLEMVLCFICLGIFEEKFAQEKDSQKKVLLGVVFTPEVNGRTLESQIRDLKDLGVNCAKFCLDWNWVEPKL